MFSFVLFDTFFFLIFCVFVLHLFSDVAAKYPRETYAGKKPLPSNEKTQLLASEFDDKKPQLLEQSEDANSNFQAGVGAKDSKATNVRLKYALRPCEKCCTT